MRVLPLNFSQVPLAACRMPLASSSWNTTLPDKPVVHGAQMLWELADKLAERHGLVFLFLFFWPKRKISRLLVLF